MTDGPAVRARTQRAGFVVAGGASSRMGRDKAAMPFGNVGFGTLLEYAAKIVEEAAGSATVIAPPDRYRHLGLLVIPDSEPGAGPLGGIVTALAASNAEWNLIAACDMPFLSAGLFHRLFEQAAASGAQEVLPIAGGRPQPLCAVYHRTALEPIQHAFASGVRKVLTALESLTIVHFAGDADSFRNLNTPEDWRAALAAPTPA